MAGIYIPEKGDIVWLDLEPHLGHEQGGLRPMVVLSPKYYNKKTMLAIFCPITSQRKGYPFEVNIPEGLKVKGVILSDQVKSLDWEKRKIKYICKIPKESIEDVKNMVVELIQ
ncbi:MAG: endoribonuclease MazF [Ignavibacteriae bacterium]|nr:MAG: endoribonuclease MazF [Ignavibacteriota bacterium]